MEAATQIVASQGLSAPTALIAKQADISTGSLFTYFKTKNELFNQLYIALKTEMASAALAGVVEQDDVRDQMAQMWSGWLHWATSNPMKRRTLAQLSVSDEINADSLEIGHRAMAGVAALLERSRENGPMRDAPLRLVANLLNAVSDATANFMILDPNNADAHRTTGYDALWRMIA